MGDIKAMSPLVATVLLIAFVVAFVALIVSTISMLTGGRHTCDNVAIDVGRESTLTVCLNQETEMLHMAIKNTGSTAIDGFAVTAAGEAGTTEEELITTLNPEASDEYAVAYPTANGALQELTIVPLLGNEEKEACEESGITLAGSRISTC